MSELVVRQAGQVATPPGPVEGGRGTRDLVTWAQEADAAYKLAETLCQTPFAGSWKGDALGAAAAILKGSEVGLTPVTALGAFDNIQGTPAPKAITLRALVQAHGHDLEIVEETDQRAVARYRRHGVGEWMTTSFTIENARAMKLLGKSNWQTQPGNMLIARVTSKAARLVASDVILGIGYSSEELYDSTPARVERVAAAVDSGADRMRGILGTQTQSQPDPPQESVAITPAQLRKLHSCLTKVGLDNREEALSYYARVTGTVVESSKNLTQHEASQVIEDLERAGRGEPNVLDPASANDPARDQA